MDSPKLPHRFLSSHLSFPSSSIPSAFIVYYKSKRKTAHKSTQISVTCLRNYGILVLSITSLLPLLP